MQTEKGDSQNLSMLITKAEKSVEGVKDQKLKEIAFSKALDFLLSGINEDKQDKLQKNIKSTKSSGKKSIPNSGKKSSKKDGPLTWLRELAEEDFFNEPKSSNDILSELIKRSHRLKPTDVTLPLQKLCHEKVLRRDKLKTNEGGKEVFHWFNW